MLQPARDVRRSWRSQARAAWPPSPAKSMLAAAARRVEGRYEANKEGNGPSPTPAAPPCEDAPVWAAFPRPWAGGRRAASGPSWRLAHVKPPPNRMLPPAASPQEQAAALARGSHPSGPQALALVRMSRLSRPHLAPRHARPTFDPGVWQAAPGVPTAQQARLCQRSPRCSSSSSSRRGSIRPSRRSQRAPGRVPVRPPRAPSVSGMVPPCSGLPLRLPDRGRPVRWAPAHRTVPLAGPGGSRRAGLRKVRPPPPHAPPCTRTRHHVHTARVPPARSDPARVSRPQHRAQPPAPARPPSS